MEYNVQLKMGGIKKNTQKNQTNLLRAFEETNGQQGAGLGEWSKEKNRKRKSVDEAIHPETVAGSLHSCIERHFSRVGEMSLGCRRARAQPAPRHRSFLFLFFSSRPPPKQGRNFIWKKKHKCIPSTSCFFCVLAAGTKMQMKQKGKHRSTR